MRGEYDLFRRAEIAAAFAPLRTAAVAVVDLSAATYLDATFLGQLALLHREVKANRGELRLVGVNRHFRRLLEIAGFTNVLAIFPSAADPAAGSYLI